MRAERLLDALFSTNPDVLRLAAVRQLTLQHFQALRGQSHRTLQHLKTHAKAEGQTRSARGLKSSSQFVSTTDWARTPNARFWLWHAVGRLRSHLMRLTDLFKTTQSHSEEPHDCTEYLEMLALLFWIRFAFRASEKRKKEERGLFANVLDDKSFSTLSNHSQSRGIPETSAPTDGAMCRLQTPMNVYE